MGARMATEADWLDDMGAFGRADDTAVEDVQQNEDVANAIETLDGAETQAAEAVAPRAGDDTKPAQTAEPDGSKPPPVAESVPQPAPEPAKEPNEVAQAVIAERRKWQERNVELQSKYDREMAELRAAIDSLKKPAPEAPPVPSYDENPAEYLRHQNEEVKRVADEARASAQRIEMQAARDRWLQAEVQAIAQEEQAFMTSAPDFREAVAHVRRADFARFDMLPDQALVQAIRGHGYEPAAGRDAQIAQLVGLNEISTAISLRRAGRNAAESYYNLARAAGYSSSTPAKSESAPKPAGPDLSTVQQGLLEARGSTARGAQEHADDGADFFSELFGA